MTSRSSTGALILGRCVGLSVVAKPGPAGRFGGGPCGAVGVADFGAGGVGREASGRGGGGGGLTPGGTFGGGGRDPNGGACLVMVLEAAIPSFS